MKPEPFYQGKVRDLFEVDFERMIIVSSDRVSAFDVVFQETIPNKGIFLNQISSHWFEYLAKKKSILYPGKTLQEALSFKNHFITKNIEKFPERFRLKEFENRSMMVYKTQRIDFECVVRGYLLGSAWKEYQAKGSICGISLPKNLSFGEKFSEPIFTPATKEEKGEHDENISFEYMKEKIGEELAIKIKNISIEIFKEASYILEKAGFILCDTKFEFGIKDNEIYLIDEVLTPDSSRFWKIEDYERNKNIQSYDKQVLRDFLETTNWNKSPPPPSLPISIINEMQKRYEYIYKKIINVIKI